MLLCAIDYSQKISDAQLFPHDSLAENKVICFPGNSGGKDFQALATDRLFSHDLLKTTQCLPLYRYTEDGERVSNITRWGIDQINGHYQREWGDDFQTLAGEDGITAEQIFAYTYAVLHDPAYRHEYAMDLLREFPRLPCTQTSTTGSRWARGCWTCTSGSSPPSPISWSGTNGRALIRSGHPAGRQVQRDYNPGRAHHAGGHS